MIAALETAKRRVAGRRGNLRDRYGGLAGQAALAVAGGMSGAVTERATVTSISGYIRRRLDGSDQDYHRLAQPRYGPHR